MSVVKTNSAYSWKQYVMGTCFGNIELETIIYIYIVFSERTKMLKGACRDPKEASVQMVISRCRSWSTGCVL